MVNDLHGEVRGLRDLLHSILWRLDSLQDSENCHEGDQDHNSDGTPDSITTWPSDGAPEVLPGHWDGSMSSSRNALSVSCNALPVERMRPPDMLNFEQNAHSKAGEQSRPEVLPADDGDVRAPKVTISENSQEGHQEQPAFAPTEGSRDCQEHRSTNGGLAEDRAGRNKRQR